MAFTGRDEHSYSVNDDELVEDVPSVVEPALAPGTYTLELVLDGYRTEVREVGVKAGETTNVEVPLKRL